MGVPRRGPPPPTVVHGTGRSERGTVYALSPTDGSEKWLYRIGEPITAPLAAAEDRLVAGTESGGTGPVPASGTLWTLTPAGELAWYEAGVDAAVVGVAARDGPAVATDEEGSLYGFRTKHEGDAGLLWSRELAGTGHPVPAMADGTAYVSRGQYVTAVDPGAGSVEWEAAPGGSLTTTPPAIVGGTAYVDTNRGCTRWTSLRVLWSGGWTSVVPWGRPLLRTGRLLSGRVIRGCPCSRGSETR